MQAILNSAARLIYGRSRYDHVTDLIKDRLHWLPIQHRVCFKCAMLVYRALHGIALSYIARFCVKTSRRRSVATSSDPRLLLNATWLFRQRKLSFEDAPSLSPVHRPGTLCRTSSRMPTRWIFLKSDWRRIVLRESYGVGHYIVKAPLTSI